MIPSRRHTFLCRHSHAFTTRNLPNFNVVQSAVRRPPIAGTRCHQARRTTEAGRRALRRRPPVTVFLSALRRRVTKLLRQGCDE